VADSAESDPIHGRVRRNASMPGGIGSSSRLGQVGLTVRVCRSGHLRGGQPRTAATLVANGQRVGAVNVRSTT
jgi:hypothetical protein